MAWGAGSGRAGQVAVPVQVALPPRSLRRLARGVALPYWTSWLVGVYRLASCAPLTTATPGPLSAAAHVSFELRGSNACVASPATCLCKPATPELII